MEPTFSRGDKVVEKVSKLEGEVITIHPCSHDCQYTIKMSDGRVIHWTYALGFDKKTNK